MSSSSARPEARLLAGLAPYAGVICDATAYPARDALQALVTARNIKTAAGAPLNLVPPSAEPYEEALYRTGALQFRSNNWHDVFNVLVWARYPESKRELNRRHCAALREETQGRGRVRDALTLFDESGAVVLASDASLLDALRGFRWKTLFCERRADVRSSMRFFLFGHAVMEKTLRPYVGLTAHALLIHVPAPGLGSAADDPDALDRLIAARIDDPALFLTPRMLSPLPVLGVPGWWPDNEDPAFYDNAQYFRPGRLRRDERDRA